jgi:hypothetical protein
MTRPPHRQTIKTERLPDNVFAADRPTPEQFADRDFRAALRHRDLTGEILGDPVIGQSALDKKLRQARETA